MGEWKLVPVEPTESIRDAMVRGTRAAISYADADDLWREALAASPAPSLPEDVERVVEQGNAFVALSKSMGNHGQGSRLIDGRLLPLIQSLASRLAEARAEASKWREAFSGMHRQTMTAEAARVRLAAESEAFRAALEGIAAPAIFFLSREDAVKMRNQARAALASLEERG